MQVRLLKIRNAYYIKLGKGGEWEADSIRRGILRLGWSSNPLTDVNDGAWGAIEEQLRASQPNKGTATRDVNALKDIVASTADDIWITFHASRLWWCSLAEKPVEEDAVSKFRRTAGGWKDCDSKGRRLLIAEIPGDISQLQGFRGTVCRVKARDALRRLLDGESSPAYVAVSAAVDLLAREVSAAIQSLHWKDFETLVDLLFRQAGWRRLSVLGETMKYADLELEEPMTGERYQVQIKSAAGAPEFKAYRDEFAGQGFRKLFFVVHTPHPNLTNDLASESVELILPDRLGRMIVNAGLVGWISAKIR
jgi:hypothetical protein